MNRISMVGCVAVLAVASGAFAQNAAPSSTESQPSAKYPHPSGQDSQPDRSSSKAKVAAGGPQKEKKDQSAGQEKKPTGRSKEVDEVAKRKAYTGSGGAKPNSSTVCSTARPTTNGGVDCGMSGNSATQGHIVTKPH